MTKHRIDPEGKRLPIKLDSWRRAAYLPRPEPHFLTYGPKA